MIKRKVRWVHLLKWLTLPVVTWVITVYLGYYRDLALGRSVLEARLVGALFCGFMFAFAVCVAQFLVLAVWPDILAQIYEEV